ncbi:MAG: hypothetical protein SFU25_05545 [Candidatus Caenarcaniphilales bacterium]|nr:hypothetical protein [Candidatus Caenarcaniphilales bacterium]
MFTAVLTQQVETENQLLGAALANEIGCVTGKHSDDQIFTAMKSQLLHSGASLILASMAMISSSMLVQGVFLKFNCDLLMRN